MDPKNDKKNKVAVDPPEPQTSVNETTDPETDQAAARAQRLIYCGPSMTNAGLSQFMVFKAGIPGHIVELAGKCPAIDSLIVSVTDLAATREAMGRAGTAQHQAYNQVIQFAKGVK